jgi:hypothetical protein
MTPTNLAKTATAGGALALVTLVGMLLTSQRGSAQNGNDDAGRIQQGFAIAPVPLNLAGKNSEQVALVGLGSYLVNAVGDCDGCHFLSAPPDFGNPDFNFLSGHNPVWSKYSNALTEHGFL